jgi:type VI secretion system protein ImpJ
MSGLAHQSMSRAEQVAYSVGEDTRLFVVQAAGEWFDPEQKLCLVVPGQVALVGPWQVVLFVANAHEFA